MFTQVPSLWFSPPSCFCFTPPSLSLHPPVTFCVLASSLGWRITAWHITHFLHLFQENHGPVVPHSSDSSCLILASSASHWAHLANSSLLKLSVISNFLHLSQVLPHPLRLHLYVQKLICCKHACSFLTEVRQLSLEQHFQVWILLLKCRIQI